MSVYTRGEVIWLLGMDREQAIDMDAYPQSSLGSMSPDEQTGGAHGGAGNSEDTQLLTIARWHDVQEARRRARLPPELIGPLAMRATGATEEEVAERLDLAHSTARRRFRVALAAVCEQLGVVDVVPLMMVKSDVPLCLICAVRTRCRLAETRYRVKGGWKITSPERYASVCEQCLAPQYRHRLKIESFSAAA